MSLTSAQHQLRWATVPQQSGPKSEGEAAVPLSVAGAGSSSNVAWAEACFRTKWYPDPFSRLATIDIGQKLKAVRLFYWEGGGELGPHLTQCGLHRGLPLYHVALIHPVVWPQHTRAESGWLVCYCLNVQSEVLRVAGSMLLVGGVRQYVAVRDIHSPVFAKEGIVTVGNVLLRVRSVCWVDLRADQHGV